MMSRDPYGVDDLILLMEQKSQNDKDLKNYKELLNAMRIHWRRQKILHILNIICLMFFAFVIMTWSSQSLRNAYVQDLWIDPQEDPMLLKKIQADVLHFPDLFPYNLEPQDGPLYSSDIIEPILMKLFNNKTHGVFVEAGAYDGQESSNTLFLEQHFLWSGLLVEPVPRYVDKIMKKHRKAWLAPACLSTTTSPIKTTIHEAKQMSYMKNSAFDSFVVLRCADNFLTVKAEPESDVEKAMQFLNCTREIQQVFVNCYPLYSLLRAVDITDVDFLSLDVEGSEEAVLKTIPFDKVNIKVMFIETDKIKNLPEFVRTMDAYGFLRKEKLGSVNLTEKITGDMFFVNKNNREILMK